MNFKYEIYNEGFIGTPLKMQSEWKESIQSCSCLEIS